MKVFTLAAGFAVGYVLGSRAGRDKYEQIVATARKAQNHPAVSQAQNKAKQLLSSASTAVATDNDTDPKQTTTSTSAVTDPAPRSSRRQPKSSMPVPDLAIDPLA